MSRLNKIINPDLLVTDIVTNDYRTADVFSKFNIDFCCGGKMPLSRACELKAVDQDEVVQELQESEIIYQLAAQWSPGFLIEYVRNVHHKYFKGSMQLVTGYVDRFIASHVKKFPHMELLTSIVKDLCGSLKDQLVYEEEKLFPYTDRLIYACRKNEAYGKFILKSLYRSSSEELIPFHAGIVNSLEQLEKITEFYNIPHNACTTQKVMLKKLQEFSNYLWEYLNLEQRYLVPAILKFENVLLESTVEA